ncbi:MAG: hypothetical protein H0X66_15165, partial [Verrucomicrobia bacterium]|nr:hypothetical protein [Verrucomicrobiota bacterium]
MKNDIQKSYGTVVAQMAAAIAGVELYAGPLTLSLVTSDAMNTSLSGLIAGETATKQAKAELRECLQAFRTAKATGRDYMFVAR